MAGLGLAVHLEHLDEQRLAFLHLGASLQLPYHLEVSQLDKIRPEDSPM